jgi:alpha-tubulin suppressor-like RCC1 family protein
MNAWINALGGNLLRLTVTLLLAATAPAVHAAAGTVVVWGDNSSGQLDVPLNQTNVVAISAGYGFNLALNGDGTVVAWGDNSCGTTNVPSDLTDVMEIAAGAWHDVALRRDGLVFNWGCNNFNPGVSGVIAVAAGWGHSLAIKSDHTVMGWGYDGAGQADVPPDLGEVAHIAAGGMHNLALKSDGTVVGWAYNSAGQTDVPPGLSNVVAIAAGYMHSLALKSDGTIVAWGDNSSGQTNVPDGLTNVVAIAAGDYHNLALKSDGNVVGWGDNSLGQLSMPAGLRGVTAIAAGYGHSAAIVTNAGSLIITKQPFSQTVYATQTARFSTMALGTPPLSYQWRFNETNLDGATGASLVVTNLGPNDAGTYTVIVSNGSGSVISSNASLTVVVCPPVIISQSPQDQLALFGTNLALSITATGPTPITYHWLFNGTNIPAQTNSILSVTNFQLADEGIYTVIASNPFFSTNVDMHLTAGDLPGALNARYLSWSTWPYYSEWRWETMGRYVHDGVAAAQSGPVANGGYSTLATSVSGPGTLTFWWMRNGYGGDEFCFYMDGVQQACIWADAYGYGPWAQILLYVPDGAHSLTWTFTRHSANPYVRQGGYLDQVQFMPGPTPPLITSGPSNVTVAATGNATFTVSATGTPPLSYQWQFNGTNISGATNTAVSLIGVQATNVGIYSVVVANECGTNTPAATLTVTPVPPRILLQPASQRVAVNGSASFAVTATGSVPFNYQWQFNGVNIAGATDPVITLSNIQAINAGNFQVLVGNDYGMTNSGIAVLTVARLLGWGNNNAGQISIPLDILDARAIAGGLYHSTCLKTNNTVSAWGSNSYGQTNVPASLSNVVAIACGFYHSLALSGDGTVLAWGAGTKITSPPHLGQSLVPSGVSNVVGIAAGAYHSVALKNDGTVVAWGSGTYSQTNTPAGLSNIIAVAAGGYHSLALRDNGIVVAWGAGTNAGYSPNYGQSKVPVDLSNAVAVAAGTYHSLALRSDGTVRVWGDGSLGQTNIPPGVTNVVSVACGGYHNLAVKGDGTLIPWGNSYYNQASVPVAVSNVVAIGAGQHHSLAVMNDGTPIVVRTYGDRSVFAGTNGSLGVTGIGVPAVTYQWQFNGMNIDGETNATLVFTNVPLNFAGIYQCVLSNRFGLTVSSPMKLEVLRAVPRCAVSSSQLTSSGFALCVNLLSGHGPIIIYASTDLMNWVPLHTNAAVLGTLQFVDGSVTNVPVRFYEAVEQ